MITFGGIPTLEETQTALRACPIAVALSDGHCWKDILYELQAMSDPPTLIVADRLADEALWAEVLNLGGYDLLTKPFNAREVFHALTTAGHFAKHQRERERAVVHKPSESEGYKSVSGAKERAASNGRY